MPADLLTEYAELAISSPAMAEVIEGMDGQAELAWVAGGGLPQSRRSLVPGPDVE